MRVPQFLEGSMKRERRMRLKDFELYHAMDADYGDEASDADKVKTETILSKYGITVPYEDTRYYGVFIYGKDARVKIDPIRYDKKIGLSDEMKKVMAKRKTHYFFPTHRRYLDYNCNIFRNEITDIKSKWLYEHKPIVDAAIVKIKSKNYSLANDYNFMCGISSHGAASARAQWATMKAAKEAEYKRFGLRTSMYAQFFHLMVSRIEAITVYVLTQNGFQKEKFKRSELFYFKSATKKRVISLEGYSDYEKMYCIWNFIKHNSISTYKMLNDKCPGIIANKATYKQGDLAIYFIDINEDLILETLDGVSRFFDAYCQLVFKENVKSAHWNYDQHFLDHANAEIESYTNPLGLDAFDDIE